MKLIVKIKTCIKKCMCRHERANLQRWHWTHGPNGNDPATVEAEYECQLCGKIVYLHLNRKESLDWATAMGHYKQAGFEQVDKPTETHQ